MIGFSFGLQTANSWTRDNTATNNFLGNGGTELNPTSALYDLEFRNYDPILGRMHQVDPMTDKYSSHTPYNYSFNSPVMLNDPSGAEPPRYRYDENGEEQSYHYQSSSTGYRFWNDASARVDNSQFGSRVYRELGESMAFGSLSYSTTAIEMGRDLAVYGSAWFTATHGTQVTDPAQINAIVGYVNAVNAGVGAFGKLQFGRNDRALATHNANGDYAQVDRSGNAFVPYTNISYWSYKRDQALGKLIGAAQTVLDVVGLVPVVGEIADGLNASIYAARGDYFNASLSGAAMIPFAGWAATGGKIGAKIWTATAKSGAVENAYKHWVKHGAEFPGIQNAKQYVEAAKDFL